MGKEFWLSFGFMGKGEVWMPESSLKHHAVAFGPTGSGKSTWLLALLYQLVLLGRGCLLIDKDNRTCHQLFAMLAEKWEQMVSPIRRRLIYPLFVGSGVAFRFDPFEISLTGRGYESWLSRTVEHVGKVMGRKQGIRDFKEQMQRERVMRDVLYMVGTRREDGTHLGLDKALDCLDLMGGKPWERLFNSVCEQLPEERARDLWRLHTSNKRDRQVEIGSTRNIFDSFLAYPAIKQMVQPGEGTINLVKAVQQNAVILAPLGHSQFFGEEQGDAIASMLLNAVIDACWFRQVKVPYYLAVEEAETILGYDFDTVLKRGRKNGCIGIFLIQHLEGLKRGN